MENQDNLRKTWDIELDLLEKLKQICKKYNLRYCASSGTLLGAIRHKGFIPWDDDIDVFVMWPDYKTLMQVAPKECQYPYCFQGVYNETDSMPSACRLRRSDTTGFTMWEHENTGETYDRGLFIDIFPLFTVPDDENEKQLQKQKVIGYWEAIAGHTALKHRQKNKGLSKNYEQYIPSFEKYVSQNGIENFTEADLISLKEKYLEACAWTNERQKEVGATSSKCHFRRLMWDTAWYDEMIEMPFENTTITCPAGYEQILERQYGDWRTPVRGGAMHEMAGLDPDTPWREFDMSKVRGHEDK